MAINPKEGKLLYHLTALDNLPSIIENGLKPRAQLKKFTDVADPEIIVHRSDFNLNSSVPFHFYAPTPFSGSVQKAWPKEQFVYLTIERKLALKNNFGVIPRHPLSFKSDPLPYNKGIDTIDWELMGKRDYLDHDCKEVCMAECLTHEPILFEFIRFIYVKNEPDRILVNDFMKKATKTHSGFSIFINPNMFVK
ncbi:DarT ssDNA thymidine ADP-ribosyltransferase family protein [Roseivirga echinicomitans]|uniref:DarT domain-containing protein n=1 Tax=Roseivirga echinicomitans TaxID=296218 RepID=A0A150XYF3_9BACT|nr:DarT ssDNA thymidine ADP-ribosyltransferase family protein [Roseivirga echinicomitans]KYG83692.1 hypothetical protein AWN68_02480 [Roseivirga echinicomitans]